MFGSYKNLEGQLNDFVHQIKLRNKPKIFCIGRNKTGTTSLKKAFSDLGLIVGDQKKALTLAKAYLHDDFKPIIKYCKSAQVFQDFPFSQPGTYLHLDKAYPNSKFILSIRDTPEQWYYSLISFHSKLFGGGSLPTVEQLKNASYGYKGWMLDTMKKYGTTEDDLYNKEALINHYLKYNAEVEKYFSNRANDFIKINIADKDSYKRLMKFLRIESPFDDFPWENRTSDLK